MWKLNRISATNLCAFKKLDYKIVQNKTTLIFGNNLDNDTQGSNGSGKSALIEAIALALTGDTLRKVKIDEIINDAADEASVIAVLSNSASKQQLTITRHIYRKSPQRISLMLQSGEYDTDTEEIVQPSVADYNQYVLNTLGLTRDEVYSNFILCKHKYKSFLSSSDKDKKEIINKFSNGILVDAAIEYLHEDLEPLRDELQQADMAVASSRGRIEAISDQINTAITEAEERSQNKAKRIAEWKQRIAEVRANIRDYNNKLKELKSYAKKLNDCDDELQKLEKSKKSILDAEEEILGLCEEYNLDVIGDYGQMVEDWQSNLLQVKEDCGTLENDLGSLTRKMKLAELDVKQANDDYQNFLSSYNENTSKLKDNMNELANEIEGLRKAEYNLSSEKAKLTKKIAELQKQLAGIIVCPKCKYEFSLDEGVDIAKARKELSKCEKDTAKCDEDVKLYQDEISEKTEQGKQCREDYNILVAEKDKAEGAVNDAQSKYNSIKRDTLKISGDIDSLKAKIDRIEGNLQSSRNKMFDEAFDILDEAINQTKSEIKGIDTKISTGEGQIESYEESISQIENSTDDDMLSSLRQSKKKYEEELGEALSNQEEVAAKVNKLQTQEQTFIQFKTHLANTKIEALSQITNEFLERIGSDIRISLSGYTILKSGKVRDKISISLIRDGVDCGSFDKFSAGEQARVNLASILAMHKLTNVHCDDDKGLDLLVLDEILEATDEAGLSSIFDALNQLQITSLVVSHGQIAENYPHKLIVNKQNGISYI